MNCCFCNGAMKEEIIDRHEENLLGVPVVLVRTVVRAVCQSCGEDMLSIPDTSGLIANIAVLRCLLSLKLSSAELKFMRKALEMTGREFAALMETTPETVSRWENNSQGVGGYVEKILRQKVCRLLKDQAPGVDYAPEMILDMKIVEDRNRSGEASIPLVFEQVKFRRCGATHAERIWDVAPSKAA
ncbi:HTH cro/C1-type domain-containing protein [Azospirillaceae bacterium]